MLRAAMEEAIVIGGEELTAKEVLARRVREFVLHGEVWLGGRRLEADTIFEWLAAVKWLYEQLDGKAPDVRDGESELVIQVVRDDQD
jgi:hypothetical protein